MIILCNSIGTPLDFKYIDLAPAYVAMTTSHIVVASKEAFYMWQFKNVKQRAIMEVSNRLKAGMEKLLTILFLIHFASTFILTFFSQITSLYQQNVDVLSAVNRHSSIIRLIGVVSDHCFDELMMLRLAADSTYCSTCMLLKSSFAEWSANYIVAASSLQLTHLLILNQLILNYLCVLVGNVIARSRQVILSVELSRVYVRLETLNRSFRETITPSVNFVFRLLSR